jgi:hypothetical protein
MLDAHGRAVLRERETRRKDSAAARLRAARARDGATDTLRAIQARKSPAPDRASSNRVLDAPRDYCGE